LPKFLIYYKLEWRSLRMEWEEGRLRKQNIYMRLILELKIMAVVMIIAALMFLICRAYKFFILNKINCYNFHLLRRRTAPLKLESPSWWHHHIAILHLEAGVPRTVCPPHGLSLTLDRAQRSRGRKLILEMISQAASSAPEAPRLACQCWPCQVFR